jgi:hypothetical protein
MQLAEAVAHLLVEEAVVNGRRLPAHAAQQPDPLHDATLAQNDRCPRKRAPVLPDV